MPGHAKSCQVMPSHAKSSGKVYKCQLGQKFNNMTDQPTDRPTWSGIELLWAAKNKAVAVSGGRMAGTA